MEIKNRINNVSRKVVSNFWATLEQVNFDFTFKNGKTKNLTHEVFGKSDGIAVLLFNMHTKKVLLTKQLRMPIYIADASLGASIEVVGGAIDANETTEETVFRETKEEVGYEVNDIQKVSTVFLTPGLVKEQVHLFVAKYTDDNKVENGGGVFNEDEEIEIFEIAFSKALEMIATNEIRDARTILLLQYLKLNNLLT